jgi:hypothetical protein
MVAKIGKKKHFIQRLMPSIFKFKFLGFYLYVYIMLRGKGAYRKTKLLKITGRKLKGFKVNNIDKSDTQRHLEDSILNRKGTQNDNKLRKMHGPSRLGSQHVPYRAWHRAWASADHHGRRLHLDQLRHDWLRLQGCDRNLDLGWMSASQLILCQR